MTCTSTCFLYFLGVIGTKSGIYRSSIAERKTPCQRSLESIPTCSEVIFANASLTCGHQYVVLTIDSWPSRCSADKNINSRVEREGFISGTFLGGGGGQV